MLKTVHPLRAGSFPYWQIKNLGVYFPIVVVAVDPLVSTTTRSLCRTTLFGIRLCLGLLAGCG